MAREGSVRSHHGVLSKCVDVVGEHDDLVASAASARIIITTLLVPSSLLLCLVVTWDAQTAAEGFRIPPLRAFKVPAAKSLQIP
jgi:hypothetical protein